MPFRARRMYCFLPCAELGFRWCLAVSDPWPRSCIFAIVQARLRHVFGLRTGALFFSVGGSKGAVSDPPCFEKKKTPKKIGVGGTGGSP